MADSAMDIFAALSQGGVRQSALDAQIQGQASRMQEAAQQEVAVQKEQADAQQVIDAQQAKADMETQTANLQFSTALGGNAKSSTYILEQLGNTLRESTLQSIDKQRQVAELDSKSFFDNPLAWLPNQFKADSIEREAMDAKGIADTAAASMQQINQLKTSGAAANKANEESVTAVTVAATMKVKAAAADMAASKLVQSQATTNINVLGALQSSNARVVDMAKTSFDVQQSQEQMAMSRQAHVDAHNSYITGEAIKRENLLQEQFQTKNMSEDRALRVEAKQQEIAYKNSRAERDKIKDEMAATTNALKKDQLELSKQRLAFQQETLPDKRKALELQVKSFEQRVAAGEAKAEMDKTRFAQANDRFSQQTKSTELTILSKEQQVEHYVNVRKAMSEEAQTVAMGFRAQGYPGQADLIEKLADNPEAWDMQKKTMEATPAGKLRLDSAIASAAEKQTSGSGMLGGSVAEVLTRVHEDGYPQLPPESDAMLKFVTQTAKDAIVKDSKSMAPTAKSTAAKLELGATAVVDATDKWRSNVEQPGSKMAAPKLGVMKSDATLVSMPLWKKVLQPQLDGGSGDSSYAVVSELAVNAVAEGRISFNDAADGLSQFYKSAMLLNNATVDFKKFAVNPQNSYIVPVETFQGTKSLDVAEPAVLRADLLMRTNPVLKHLYKGSTAGAVAAGVYNLFGDE
jgi:hypothetical protein